MQDRNSETYSDIYCPSFNCYSTDKLPQIASNVCRELDKLDLNISEEENPSSSDEFEFVSLYRNGDDVSVFNGAKMGPVFPVFNRDLLLEDQLQSSTSSIREDNDDCGVGRPSCSSSEAEELVRIPDGTYCVWTPKSAVTEMSTPSRCKKSNSTGSSSSKRWRYLKDLIKRSNSDGNKSFVFMTPLSSSKKIEEKIEKLDMNKGKKSLKDSGKEKKGKLGAAHEAFYGRNKTLKEGDYKRRTSFLPYRQGLLGFFANVNTMGRTFPPAL